MSKRALLVIDLQNGVGPLIGFDQLITKVNALIAEYRQHGLPIIFIQHEEAELEVNSEAWQLVSALEAASNDHYVRKTHVDSFYHTELASLLDQLKVNQLEICGAEIPYCIDATIKAAFDRGYQIFMRHGTVATERDALLADDMMVRHYEHIWSGRFVQYLDENQRRLNPR